MELVAAGLGLPVERLNAELYKLLIYRPRGFFAEHRDTEKVPGIVATLSLSLPTPGAGGELVVRHGGREQAFDLRAGEPSEMSFAAFYADCLHEVRPLAEGHRVTLVFNLFLGSSGDVLAAPDHSDVAAQTASCTPPCFGSRSSARRCMCLWPTPGNGGSTGSGKRTMSGPKPKWTRSTSGGMLWTAGLRGTGVVRRSERSR